jgi:hypothetical protein
MSRNASSSVSPHMQQGQPSKPPESPERGGSNQLQPSPMALHRSPMDAEAAFRRQLSTWTDCSTTVKQAASNVSGYENTFVKRATSKKLSFEMS